MTGYEIKKIMQSTPFLHWSGNNNQIYKAFAELLDEGFVAKEVRHQAGAPSKNIYSITDAGREELKNWLLAATDEPFFRKQMLVKLALADRLNRGELEQMLASYADVVRMQAALAARDFDKCYFAEQAPAGKRELIDLIRENIAAFYSGELQWVQKVQEFVAGLPDGEAGPEESAPIKEPYGEGSAMECRIMEFRGNRYLYLTGGDALFQWEQDAVEIIALCAEHDTNAVVLEGKRLSDDFVKLRTGLAGAVLQKLGNYHIKAAVVIQDAHHFTGRFREMVSEHRNGNTFRIFTDPAEAVGWLFH
jgi:DNA-binding PadR family transcriptional regulator